MKSKYFWVEPRKYNNEDAMFDYKNIASFRASNAWRKLRELKLYENPLCELCQEKGEIKGAIDVDHIIPISENKWLALEYTNLQSVCKACHYEKTGEENSTRKPNKKQGGIANKKWKF